MVCGLRDGGGGVWEGMGWDGGIFLGGVGVGGDGFGWELGMEIENIVEMIHDRFSTGKGVSFSWVHNGCGFIGC